MQPVQFSFGDYQELFQSLKGQLDERVAGIVADIFQNKIFLDAGVSLRLNQVIEQQPEEKRREIRLILGDWVKRFVAK